MFKKIFKVFVLVLVTGLLFADSSSAQGQGSNLVKVNSKVSKSPYPVFTLSPVAGAIFPMSELGNNYQAGFNGGIDAGLRINKELSLYSKVGYYSLTSTTQGAPNSSYFELSAGPRYYFNSKNLKSNFFIETGVGAYIYSRDAFESGGTNYDRISNTNVGLNVGPGVTLQLSKSVDVILKSKYHMIFNDQGTRSFVAALGGLEFKF